LLTEGRLPRHRSDYGCWQIVERARRTRLRPLMGAPQPCFEFCG